MNIHEDLSTIEMRKTNIRVLNIGHPFEPKYILVKNYCGPAKMGKLSDYNILNTTTDRIVALEWVNQTNEARSK